MTENASPSNIVVRRPDLAFEKGVKRYYLNDSPLNTHFFNGINFLFPDGERFFVKSVHDQMHKIDDPTLCTQVKAFSGQEGQHAKEHQRFFDVLETQGYRIRGWLKRLRTFIHTMGRLPAPLRLSITAGAEHYTATIGALALELGMVEDADPVMRQLITWHAIEEVEHKTVAYDVLQATYPSYLLRIVGFALATTAIMGLGVAGMRMLIKQDGLTRRQLRRYRKELRTTKEVEMGKRMTRTLLQYLRPGFHPNDIDDQYLIAKHLGDVPMQAPRVPTAPALAAAAAAV